MEKIGEPCAPSQIVYTVEEGAAFAAKIGYPVVLRPAYTLGGSGGGIANNPVELEEILANGLRLSRVGQVDVYKRQDPFHCRPDSFSPNCSGKRNPHGRAAGAADPCAGTYIRSPGRC